MNKRQRKKAYRKRLSDPACSWAVLGLEEARKQIRAYSQDQAPPRASLEAAGAIALDLPGALE